MTKRQHFVAATYLSKWDLNPPKRSRKAKIWWTDGEKCLLGTVESLALQRYLYEQGNTKASEAYFGEFEGDWNEFVEELERRPQPSKKLLKLVLLQAVVMALRNPSYADKSKRSRFESTRSAISDRWPLFADDSLRQKIGRSLSPALL